MKGTVWQRGKTWTYAFSIEQGGKRRQISKGGFRTKKLAQELAGTRNADANMATSSMCQRRRPASLSLMRGWFVWTFMARVVWLSPSRAMSIRTTALTFSCTLRFCDIATGWTVPMHAKVRPSADFGKEKLLMG